ncbi:MAG TPA: phosphate acyltransferase PlsX, partial [Pseudomonadales bacterium]|nr:phosphate acyltransferase PlsX [Pseudomonadales bacterium]
MSASLSLAVDVMGGDHGPTVTVPAVLSFLSQRPEAKVFMVGDQAQINQQLGQHLSDSLKSRIEIVHASEVVTMDEKPSSALRTKKDSSMRVAINLVRDGHAKACVSAGNTGALMAISRFVLKTHPKIDRPAICTSIPTMNGSCLMLDLGANVDCSAEHLYQFALMGNVLARALSNLENPKVGLLNIGEEEIKGNDQVKAANDLLAASDHFNYIGYVEGDGVFCGDADVVVCDGFVGNVALKSSEGVAKLIQSFLKEEFTRSWFTKILALIALPVLNGLK